MGVLSACNSPVVSRCSQSRESPELRVQSLQLDAGVGGCELPVGFGVVLVAMVLPCGDFVGEDLLVGDAAIQTLRREHAEFGFGHVEPTAVLGRVVPFEALDEPARLSGGEGFVERGGLVGVEIVLHQQDLRRVGKMHVRQIPEHMGIIDGGVVVGHFHMPPPFQRREHHEQIGDAIAFVFVIVTRLASRLRRDRRARLDDQLLRGFVEAHERTLRIVRPLIDLQHVFHIGDKGRAGVRRDHPLLLAMRFENVFFSVRPIVLSLARSTMCSSTTFSSSRRRLQRAKPSGAGERLSAINFASAAPSKIRGRAELGLYLRLNTASNPSSTSWRLVRSIVAILVSSAAAIRLSLQPSPSDTSAFSRMRAFVSSWAERLPLRINSSSWACSSALNRTTYFLTTISFPTTNHLHRCLAATEIQKLPSFSMTGATRLARSAAW